MRQLSEVFDMSPETLRMLGSTKVLLRDESITNAIVEHLLDDLGESPEAVRGAGILMHHIVSYIGALRGQGSEASLVHLLGEVVLTFLTRAEVAAADELLTRTTTWG